MNITVGDRIQHISGTGDIWTVVLHRPEHSDWIAITTELDPRLTRIINLPNWKLVK